MALIQSKSTPTGDTYDYWRISHFQVDHVHKIVSVVVGLYKDSGENTSAEIRTYTWEGDDCPLDVAAMDIDNPYKIIYTKLKTLDEWDGATDDL